VDSPKPTIGIRGVVLLCIAVVIFSELLGLPILRRAITPAATPSNFAPAAGAPSLVAWNEATTVLSSTGNPIRGEFISRRCESCHGVEGFSSRASTPNLAGIDAQYLWKQLQDFRSGKRKSVLMQQIAGALTPRDAADVAAYFAALPNAPDAQFNPSFPQAMHDQSAIEAAQRLLAVGDPTRGIPPCQACHGPLGYVRPAPSLAWQNSGYVLGQLNDFAQGARTNDVNLPMRQ
jgi:cytochrome c553